MQQSDDNLLGFCLWRTPNTLTYRIKVHSFRQCICKHIIEWSHDLTEFIESRVNNKDITPPFISIIHILKGVLSSFCLFNASNHNLAQLGYKNLIFASFECSFMDFLLLKYELTQAQVTKAST